MDFSFITIPAQLKLTIPSKPSLNLSAGVFWSFLQDQNLNSNYYYYEPQKRDFGFIYSAGLSYPFSKDFDVLLRVRYLAGRKDFLENKNYRHGSIDFNLGITFNGFLGGADDDSELPVRTDSSQNKLNLIYFGGTDLSWNSPGNSPWNYSVSLGPSAGFRLDIPVGRKTEFRTGLSFERTGYSLRDSSDVFYTYIVEDDAEYLVDTKTTIDYIEIPASLKINIGRSNTFYISTGPYLSIKLNARSTGEAFSNEENNSMYRRIRTVVYDDLERLIKDNDSGWSFGAGITIPVFAKFHAEAGMQYKQGFRDVFDATYFSGTNKYDNMKTVIRNRTLSFHIGLKIPIHN
jgi:opacity protein-like surface antigen